METTIKWHESKKELPEHSGKYLVASGVGYITTLNYSSKYKKFNVRDNDSPEFVEEVSFFCPMWASLEYVETVLNLAEEIVYGKKEEN